MRFLLLSALCCLFAAAAAAQQVQLPTAPTWMSDETAYNGTGLDIGDVDGNGWLDLAVSNGNDIVQAPNLVYLQSAGGVLPTTASWSSTDERYSGHCQLADLDQDGYPELMVANYISAGWGTAQVQIYANIGGSLELAPSWESPSEFHSFRAVFGDPDGDGDLDLAVATGEAYNQHDEQNLIFFNHDGQLEATASWRSTLYDRCYDAKFVDWDLDGDQDLAFLGSDSRVTIYENQDGVIATSPVWMTANDDDGNTFDFDDLDGDGRPDLLVGFNAQLGGSGRFAVFLTGGGELHTVPDWTSENIGYCSAVVCADMDGVNGPDLVTGGWWHPMRIYLNDGNGGFPTEPDWQSEAAWESVVENIALADLDDGRTVAATAAFAAGERLLVLPDRHLQRINRVVLEGGQALPADSWCSSLRDGWVSLAAPLAAPAVVEYEVSDGLDLAISNWDDATFVFHNLLPTSVPEDRAPGALVSAWPNPFNPRTTIGLRLAADVSAARLRIFDLRGRLVETLHEGPLSAGEHRVEWRASGVASGVYLYRLEAGGESASGKVVLAK
jgi:hypothetical protein